MITKSDWKAVRQQFERQNHPMADEQPTVEEMLAYTRGELRSERAERVREYLTENPDMARALTEPFPGDEARPGDPGYLSQEDLVRQWTRLRESIHGPAPAQPAQPNVAPFPAAAPWRRTAMALAASLVLALGAILWLARENMILGRQPRVAAGQRELFPIGGQRGPAAEPPEMLTAQKDSYAFLLRDTGRTRRHGDYAIDMVNVGVKPERLVFSRRAPADGDIIAFVDRSDLAPGTYEFRLFGVDGNRRELLETYPLQVR